MNKHVLSLKLTLPEASCTVDETPTPSRFLKNFSKVSTDFLDRIDAQGTSPEKNSAINFVVEQDPFAETFRRASISKPKLHIPTIILTDENSGSLNTPSITLNPATRSPEAALPNLTVTVDDILPLNKDPKHSAVGPLNLSTSPVVSSDLTPGKHSTSSEVVEQVNGHTNKSSQKSSTNSSSQSSNGTNSSSQSSNSSSLSSDTSDEKKKTRGRTPKFLYQGITDKKERHRVRNREAAMRCREKKKMWKSTLQTSIDELKELKEKFMVSFFLKFS